MRRADMDPDLRLLEEVAEGEHLPGGDVGLLVEGSSSSLITQPDRSVIRPDGTVKVVVIRPCVSRGKKVRGLPPIYTPQMLAECANVFTGWPMFMDHVSEEMQEALRRKGRSVNELGGRMVETWWDPSFTHPEDAKFGFVQGAVLGYALPQPASRAMLEADPEILRLSINAWPTGARKSRAPWNGQEGMLIEGISEEPPGSVDWVIRAGAGGRVLQEAEQFAVSVLEGAYLVGHEPQERGMKTKKGEFDFNSASAEEIIEHLQENHPGILEGEEEPVRPASANGFTPEQVREMLSEQREAMLGEVRSLLEEHEATEDERVTEELTRRDQFRALERKAHKLIEDAEGLTPGWIAELKSKYVVLPSGPSRALSLCESDEDGLAEDKLRESIEADVERASELIQETKPEVKPHGLGGGSVEEQDGQVHVPKPGENEFIDHLVESGFGKDPEEVIKKMRGEAVNG